MLEDVASSKMVMMSPSGNTGSILYQNATDMSDEIVRLGSKKYCLKVLMKPTQLDFIPNGPYENEIGAFSDGLNGPEMPVLSNRTLSVLNG